MTEQGKGEWKGVLQAGKSPKPDGSQSSNP